MSTSTVVAMRKESRKADDPVEPRFLKARKEWDDRYMALARGKRNWQIAALVMTLAAGGFAVALSIVAVQARPRPFLVTSNDLGELQVIQNTRELTGLTERQYMAELARFIRNARSVVADPGAQKQFLDQTYGYVSRGVERMLNTFYAENNPYTLSERYTQTTRVRSVQRIAENTWQIRWYEDRHSRSGALVETMPWVATLHVTIRPRTELGDILLNPGGVTITSLTWSPELGGPEEN